jgi:hypothetical protein
VLAGTYDEAVKMMGDMNFLQVHAPCCSDRTAVNTAVVVHAARNARAVGRQARHTGMARRLCSAGRTPACLCTQARAVRRPSMCPRSPSCPSPRRPSTTRRWSCCRWVGRGGGRLAAPLCRTTHAPFPACMKTAQGHHHHTHTRTPSLPVTPNIIPAPHTTHPPTHLPACPTPPTTPPALLCGPRLQLRGRQEGERQRGGPLQLGPLHVQVSRGGKGGCRGVGGRS